MDNNGIFKLNSNFQPAGGQIETIKKLMSGIEEDKKNQVLLGVTGSGKTFVMASLIEKLQRPTLIMAHNKTLAAQLYSEMKEFFPNNSVEYFISFFDYYQPEAYIPSSDTYIDKDSAINSKIEQMKLSALYSLLERRDVIIVASVSSIYGIGEKSHYESVKIDINVNQKIAVSDFAKMLVELQYTRNDLAFDRSNFRIRGDVLEIKPAHLDEVGIRVSFFDDEIESINSFDPLTGRKLENFKFFRIYSSSMYATPKNVINKAIPKIQTELYERIEFFKNHGKLIEAQRIEERTNFDLEMLVSTGYCKGIEHYIRYLRGSEVTNSGIPSTLFDYLPSDTILFVDESHVSVPQIRGMFNGDFSRKSNLVNYGFRLPSCLDNRPLKFEEWNEIRPQTVFVSATPAEFELNIVEGAVVEQIIRPTGLLDPVVEVKPTTNQVMDLMEQIKIEISRGFRTLALTLTKKMAEHLTTFLLENSIKAKYMHSDIDSIERVEIIRDLRLGKFDVLVGINLLREGLDIPECSLVAILDADKEGFLRSKTSLIQTIGRAARNSEGRVILYGDKITRSMNDAMDETKRRRAVQEEYNKKHNITPTTTIAKITNIEEIYSKGFEKILGDEEKIENGDSKKLSSEKLQKIKQKLQKEMEKQAENLNFEEAIAIRDEIKKIDDLILQI
jgi:excinuclease ABC subunit B